MNNTRDVKLPWKNHPSSQKLACEQALSDKGNNIKNYVEAIHRLL